MDGIYFICGVNGNGSELSPNILGSGTIQKNTCRYAHVNAVACAKKGHYFHETVWEKRTYCKKEMEEGSTRIYRRVEQG